MKLLTQRVSIVWLLASLALAPLGMSAGGCGPRAVVGAECRQDAGPDSPLCACERNGKNFANGKTFPAGDGCNLCACRPDGSTHCTDAICDTDSSDGGGGHGGSAGDAGVAGGCDYLGEHHAEDESFFLVDGCSICTCMPDGGRACTGDCKTCGGLLDAKCAAGEYCKYTARATCGYTDAPGHCEPMPTACTEDYTPVCGCNRQTYANECTAASSGQSVLAPGECN
jgi:hypothetical protein